MDQQQEQGNVQKQATILALQHCNDGNLESLEELGLTTQQLDNIKQVQTGKLCVHVAAENGHLHIVRYLLGMGCDFDVQDREGDTPFHLASCIGLSTLSKKLLQPFRT